MAGSKIKSGTKLRLSLESNSKNQSDVLRSTYELDVDDSSFLISVPLRNGAPVQIDPNDKIYFVFEVNGQEFKMEGFAEFYLKKGIRTYIRIRKVSNAVQFFQRADTRFNIALRVVLDKTVYPTEGEIRKYTTEGLTTDISNSGLAVMTNATFSTGEIIEISLPSVEKIKGINVRAEICWFKEKEKDKVAFRHITGLRFIFTDDAGMKKIAKYIAVLTQDMRQGDGGK